MSKVSTCKVEECMYNNNMECHAEGIEVLSSTLDKKCSQSANTMCQTFAPKG
ncbi:MAG: DUF1540 domain-containing protein [Bacillota bacterium]